MNCSNCNRSTLVGGKLTCGISGEVVDSNCYCDVYEGSE